MATPTHKSEPTVKSRNHSAALLTFMAVFIFLAAKSPDALTNPQFWAEDGTIFFQQQFEHVLPQLLVPYAGYLHLIPRLIAYLANALPYKDAPLFYNLSALLIDTGALLYFCRKSKFLAHGWIPVLVFMFSPSSGEIFGSLTNVQWFVQLALFAAVIFPFSHEKRAKSFGRQVFDNLTILVMALTGPFSIICLLVGGALRVEHNLQIRLNRNGSKYESSLWDRLNHRALAIASIGAIIQVAYLLSGTGRHNTHPFSISVVEELVLLATQQHMFGCILLPRGLLLLILLALGVVGLVRYRLRLSYRAEACAAMLAFAYIQILAIACENTGLTIVDPFTMGGDRYFVFAKIAIWMSVAAALRSKKEPNNVDLELLVPAALIYIAILNPSLLQRKPLPDMHWRQLSKYLSAQRKGLAIPINPSSWYITVPPRN